MQLAAVDSGRPIGAPTLERTVAARSGAAPGINEAQQTSVNKDAAVESRESRIGPMRGGLRSLDTQFNQRIAASQRTIEFLGRADAQLQNLRTTIAAKLGTGRGEVANDVDVAQQIRRFDALWRERTVATGGALDNQLDQVEPGTALQRFKVRGLTMDLLTKGEAETLYLAVGGRTERAAAVSIEPGLDAVEITQRLDRALAPNGIRVSCDRQGELMFSVREAEWTHTRDLLAIKGDGRRFPTGPFNAARIVAEQPLIRPHEWSIDSPTALRDTLQKVTTAQNAVRHARQLATDALADEARNLATSSAEAQAQESAWCADFARTFEATAGRGDYRTLSALSPALIGMHRDRVMALLRRA